MKEKRPNDEPADATKARGLSDQGQRWHFLTAEPKFELPERTLEVPLEITIDLLRVARRVDETVLVHGNFLKSDVRARARGGR